MKVTNLLFSSFVLLAAVPSAGRRRKKMKKRGSKRQSTTEYTVASAACDPALKDLFSTLCELIKIADLFDTLNDPDGTFTVFAPTNMAFEDLPEEILNAVLNDVDLLRTVLLFHTVSGQEVLAKDLVDGGEITMANGGISKTTRPRHCKIYQSGPGNDAGDLPRIILSNVGVYNGVIHGVDEVLLPTL